MGELAADDEWQIINDNEHYPQEDYSTPEWETDLEKERDREEGEYEPEDIRMDARCQERKRRMTKHTTS